MKAWAALHGFPVEKYIPEWYLFHCPLLDQRYFVQKVSIFVYQIGSTCGTVGI